jgi:excisionase family DNA binding protein
LNLKASLAPTPDFTDITAVHEDLEYLFEQLWTADQTITPSPDLGLNIELSASTADRDLASFSGIDISATAERFLTAEEAAEYLGGLNSRTVTRWAREGYLPSYPIGEGKRRLWRFLESDLERWMLSRRTGQISIAVEASANTLISATDAPNRGICLEG